VLAVTFGAHITADQTALAIVALSAVLSAFGRTQVVAAVAPPVHQPAPGAVPVDDVRR
jgi:hypothetical protein